MGVSSGRIEIRDLEGSTTHEVGTVGTTPVDLPSSADKAISELLINTQAIDSATKTLQISFDGGTNYFTLKRNTLVGWSVKGRLQQIKVKGSAASTNYDILINFEK